MRLDNWSVNFYEYLLGGPTQLWSSRCVTLCIFQATFRSATKILDFVTGYPLPI